MAHHRTRPARPQSRHFTYAGFVDNVRCALIAVPTDADVRFPQWGQYIDITTQEDQR